MGSMLLRATSRLARLDEFTHTRTILHAHDDA